MSKDKKGDPFFFLGDSSNRGKSDGASDKGDSNDEDGADKSSVISPDHFSIDDNIPHPSSCDDSSSCSNCLQELVPIKNQINETFYQLVEMVDELDVSHILNMISTISHIILGYQHSKHLSRLHMAIHSLDLGRCPSSS